MTRIALVLGAGGVVGQAYHSGVLKAVADLTGFDPRTADTIVGTSAGSVAAASLRAGVAARDLYARATGRPLSPEAVALLERLPLPNGGAPVVARTRRTGPSSPQLIGRMFARPLEVRPALAMTALLPEGRRDTSSWFTGFDAAFAGRRWPEATMLICAVDLDRGVRVVFGAAGAPAASVSQAVHASCAIPAIFQPAVIDGVRYVDGGVHSPTNADLVADAGRLFDAVVISSPMTADVGLRELSNPEDRGLSWPAAGLRVAARLPAARLLARERRALEELGVPSLVFEPTTSVLEAMGVQPMDFRKRGPVAEAGYEAARALLDSVRGDEVGGILARAGGR